MHEAQIEQMLAMNITPLELFYTEVRDVISTARTKAYKTEVLVRSVSLGDLNASQYQPTANRSNQCIAVAMWALTQICREITELVMEHEHVLQMHGFYVDTEKKAIRFDIVLDFARERSAVYHHIADEIREKYPDYTFQIIMDTDFSD